MLSAPRAWREEECLALLVESLAAARERVTSSSGTALELLRDEALEEPGLAAEEGRREQRGGDGVGERLEDEAPGGRLGGDAAGGR